MTCICGHPRGWHRVQDLVRLGHRCHAWGCPCDRFLPGDDGEPEPGTRAYGRPGSHLHRGAA